MGQMKIMGHLIGCNENTAFSSDIPANHARPESNCEDTSKQTSFERIYEITGLNLPKHQGHESKSKAEELYLTEGD